MHRNGSTRYGARDTSVLPNANLWRVLFLYVDQGPSTGVIIISLLSSSRFDHVAGLERRAVDTDHI